MNPNAIFHTIFQLSHSVWDCAVTMGGRFSPELVCSVTVNATILAAVLFGAVWLLIPSRSRERSASRRNGPRRG